MNVEYIGHYGDDLLVVNCARVSMGKWHKEFNLNTDTKLINYLAEKNHFMPFCHPHVTLRIIAPVFIARQLAKHQIGLSWSEESLRYVEKRDPPLFKINNFRKQSSSIKQGSLKETVEIDENKITDFEKKSIELYNYLLDSGVCREQARAYLPLNLEVQWIWTGSLAAFARIYKLRSSPDAQIEIQQLADQIHDIISPLYPCSWRALVSEKNIIQDDSGVSST